MKRTVLAILLSAAILLTFSPSSVSSTIPAPGRLATTAPVVHLNTRPVAKVTKAKPKPKPLTVKQYARVLVGSQTQYRCMNEIIILESHWNPRAGNINKSYGIPQSLPGDKMAKAGRDWRTDGKTQVRWMVRYYVRPRYGTMCNALTFHLAHGWY